VALPHPSRKKAGGSFCFCTHPEKVLRNLPEKVGAPIAQPFSAFKKTFAHPSEKVGGPIAQPSRKLFGGPIAHPSENVLRQRETRPKTLADPSRTCPKTLAGRFHAASKRLAGSFGGKVWQPRNVFLREVLAGSFWREVWQPQKVWREVWVKVSRSLKKFWREVPRNLKKFGGKFG